MKVCMILEGSYPYVRGGVSSWMHQYIQAMPQIEFILWCIGADSKDKDNFKYELPDNVVAVEQLFLNDALKVENKPSKKLSLDPYQKRELKKLLTCEYFNWDVLFKILVYDEFEVQDLLLCEDFFNLMKEVCMEGNLEVSFSDYFYTIRSMLLPVLHVIKGNVPEADIYHSTATGYSGVIGSLATWKNNKPYILTEHGIYTREREEELLQATWVLPEMRQYWIKLFYLFSNCAYEKAAAVTALFPKANITQQELGCSPEKTRVIANGVHYERFKNIPLKKSDGWIDIGAVIRIAKIKDVKTLIYSFMECKNYMQGSRKKIRLHIMGDVDDKEYFEECKLIIEQNNIEDIVFTGVVNVIEYMEKIDFTILTSISEGQPLSVLESFAARRPCVTTDVGCCRDLLEGVGDDKLGMAGICVPPMHKEKLALAMKELCEDDNKRLKMGEIGQKRVEKYYTHEISMKQYVDMYEEVLRNWR